MLKAKEAVIKRLPLLFTGIVLMAIKPKLSSTTTTTVTMVVMPMTVPLNNLLF